MSWPLTADALNERLMEQGSQNLLRAIQLAQLGKDPQTSSNLHWADCGRSSQFFPAGSQKEGRAVSEKDIQAEANRLPRRDPCPRCGTRQDIGCKHTKRLGIKATNHELLTKRRHSNKVWDSMIDEEREKYGYPDIAVLTGRGS